ncbi:MAG: hypothetical protein QOK37_4792 [Thermoanaerobaculia bacterium]|jgi:hypothetical protein|nr:hypothetical protein [Thermoanaerobaculia bacterium]
MKRLLVVLAISFASTAAFAQVADRDVLVTPEGTVYTATAVSPSSSAEGTSGIASVVDLAVQKGSGTEHQIVPDSVVFGSNFGGALAYDTDSKTLFVLWIHMANRMSSELLLASYRDSKWQPAVVIDHQAYTDRSSLRLGITRRVSQLQKDGSYADVPALLLHAVWWDDSHSEARYALLPIENGALSAAAVDIHSLEEFVAADSEAYHAVSEKFNAEILHHPAIVSSPMQSTVDVVFGDTKNNSLHGVTLHPIADSRIHIPVGIGGGNGGGGGRVKPLSIAAPPNFTADWKGPFTVLERGDRIVLANTGDTALNYITYSDGAWTSMKSIAIDAKFPAEAAISALDKMLSTQ